MKWWAGVLRGSGRGRKEDWEMCSAEVDKVKKKSERHTRNGEEEELEDGSERKVNERMCEEKR